MAAYGIKQRTTGQYFAGFDVQGNPTWSAAEEDAAVWTNRLHASAQALLLARFDSNVQRKPVAL